MFSPMFVRHRDPCAALHSIAGLQGMARRVPAKYPALNIAETDEAFFVEAEIPGVRKDNLEISVAGKELIISGERKENVPGNASAHRRETAHGKFTRTLHFRDDVDAGAVEATFKDGVLTLKLPKAPHSRPRKIAVNAH